MKAIQLYKFVSDNKIEYHWYDDDVILFINNWLIDEWYDLLSPTIFDDEGIQCVMKDGYFCFEMQDICEHYGIDMKEVFDAKNGNC